MNETLNCNSGYIVEIIQFLKNGRLVVLLDIQSIVDLYFLSSCHSRVLFTIYVYYWGYSFTLVKLSMKLGGFFILHVTNEFKWVQDCDRFLRE